MQQYTPPTPPKLNIISFVPLSHMHSSNIYTVNHTCTHHLLMPILLTQKRIFVSGFVLYPATQTRNIKRPAMGGQTLAANGFIKEASCDIDTEIMLKRCGSWKSLLWVTVSVCLCVRVMCVHVNPLSVERDYTKQPQGLWTSVRWLFACKWERETLQLQTFHSSPSTALTLLMSYHSHE